MMPTTQAMATSCLIGVFVEGKTIPNTSLVHAPPPTGQLPTFPGLMPVANKIKK